MSALALNAGLGAALALAWPQAASPQPLSGGDGIIGPLERRDLAGGERGDGLGIAIAAGPDLALPLAAARPTRAARQRPIPAPVEIAFGVPAIALDDMVPAAVGLAEPGAAPFQAMPGPAGAPRALLAFAATPAAAGAPAVPAAGSGSGAGSGAPAATGAHAGDPSAPMGPPRLVQPEPLVVPVGGGPIQPQPGSRRDPIDPPLLDAEATREWVLAVRLNGRDVSQGSVFLEDPKDGGFYASLLQLAIWRVRTDDAKVVSFQGDPFYPLAAIPGAVVEVDRAQLAMRLTIPSDGLDPYRIDPGAGTAATASAGWGGFVDYDVLASTGSEVDNRLDSLLEIGGFSRMGVMHSSFRVDDATSEGDVIRLDTTFAKDLPDRMETLRIGDSLTTGGAFAQSVRFAGLQWGSNFSTDPAFVSFPLPTIGGLVEQDSVVDVVVNNIRQATGDVPAGPFQIDNVPVLTGAGEIQLVVTDLLGRERVVTQSYYVSSRLLKQGLHDFGYELGFQRQNYGGASFEYGDLIGSLTHRYGVDDSLTIEGHGELELDRQSATGGGSLRVGHWGVVSGGAGVSVEDGHDVGALGQLAYEYTAPGFNIGARTRYTTSSFRQAGADDGRVERVDQASLGFDMGDLGRMGFLAINQERYQDEDVRSLSVSHSLQIGPGFLLLRLAQLVSPNSDTIVGATYSLPLDGFRMASTEIETGSDGTRGRAQFRQSRGPSDIGLDYRLAAEAGDGARRVDARFNYQHEKVGLGLDVENGDGDTNLRGNVNGSVVLVDGKAKLSRRTGQSFGMVALPGFKDVRVYLDNREVGRTDSDGYLLVPSLRPYQANRIRVEIEDLPIDAQIGADEMMAVPYDRAGVTVGFKIADERPATAMLRGADGKALPAGLKLAALEGGASAWVANGGFSQLSGVGDQPVTVTGSQDGRSWSCTLPPVAADTGPLPDLGEITCR